MFKELKNDIETIVGQAVFKLVRSEQSKYCFLINNSRTAWPTLIFMLLVPWAIYYRMHILFFKKVLIILR